MAACSHRNTDHNVQLLTKHQSSDVDSKSSKNAVLSNLQNNSTAPLKTPHTSLKGEKSKNHAEQLSNLPLDEYNQLLEDAYQNKGDVNPMLQQIISEVEATEKDNSKSFVEGNKRGKHQNKKSRSLLSDIYCQTSNPHRNASTVKKRYVTHSLSESTKNEINPKVSGPRGVNKDQHYQSLQDLATMVGCESMKSAGVGRGIAKLHNKTLRANSFTHETCIAFDQKKSVHSSASSVQQKTTAPKTKPKQDDKQSSLDTFGLAQSLVCESVNISENKEELSTKKSDKPDCVTIDMMDIDDEEELRERTPLLQEKEDPFEEAVSLNMVDNFQAVDDSIMLPLQTMKKGNSYKNCEAREDSVVASNRIAGDIVTMKNVSNKSSNQQPDDLFKKGDIDLGNNLSAKDEKKKKKKSSSSSFSLIPAGDDMKKLDQNGNPIIDNAIRRYGAIPPTIAMLPSNTTTVYPANQTISLTSSSCEQEIPNTRKNKNRDRHKANVMKAEEMPGYCGYDPIESILDYINSTDKNVKRGCKESIPVPESKKSIEKKDIKKKKKLSSSSSFQNNGGSADEDSSSKNSSEGDPSSGSDGKMYIELCSKSLPTDVALNNVIVDNVSCVHGPESLMEGQNFYNGPVNNELPANLKVNLESSTLTPCAPNFSVISDGVVSAHILDSASLEDANEFREVKNRKIRKNNKKSKFSRNIYNQRFGPSDTRQPEVSNCSSRSDSEMLMLDGIPLAHRPRPISTDKSRRKSTSSMPPSDHSSAENSDHDSVHSLPVVSKTAPPKLAKLPHTTPSSSSSTPHTSYADIAKMAMGASCKQISASSVTYPLRSSVISDSNDSAVPVVGPLTVENVARINQFEHDKCEQFNSCNPYPSSVYSSNGKVDKDDKVVGHLDDINCDQDEPLCAYKVSGPLVGASHASNAQSKTSEFPPLSVVNDEKSDPSFSGTKKNENSMKSIEKNSKDKMRPSSSAGSSNENKVSRPPVIIMDDVACPADYQFDGELTFGFEINEKLLEMTFNDEVVDSVATNVKADVHRETITPSFISPIYQAIENPETDRTNYNYFENIKFLGSAWLDVQSELHSDDRHGNVCYYNCDA